MFLYFVITEQCNLFCPFCIRGTKKSFFMDCKTFSTIIQANDFSKDTILLTGGEPTLHEELPQFLKMASERAAHVVLCSNGTSHVDFAASNFAIQLSLDGTRKIHDAIRGSGSFQKCLDSFSFYRKKGVPVTLSSTVCPQNVRHMASLCRLINRLNPVYWKVSLDQNDWMNPKGVGIERWNRLVDQLLGLCTCHLSIQRMFAFPAMDKIKDFKGKNPGLNCGCCTGKVYIYPDFEVFPCTCLRDFPLGNLKTESLSQILRGKGAVRFSAYSPAHSQSCKSCRYLLLCNGGCIGASYRSKGSLGHGDPRCPLQREEQR